MPRVKGLLYLSDGDGIFPQEAPSYPVTFLILEQEYYFMPDIPSWVNVLCLNENDFTLKEDSK